MLKKMFWLPVIALLLLLMLSTPASAAVVITSYSDVGRTVPEDNFTVLGAPVYMQTTGLVNNKQYEFRYFDSGSTLLLTDGPITAIGTTVDSEITPSNYPSAASGLWTCECWRIGVGLQGSDTFTVQQSAIPEFPTALSGALVAGICFGIYYWMRRRLGHAQA